jgi:hypothetical protein
MVEARERRRTTGIPMTSGILSARKKLDRAQHHLETLRAELHAFRADSSYEFDIVTIGNKQRKPDIYVKAKVTKAPDSWSLITEAHLKLAQTVKGWRWEQIPCGIEYNECIDIPGCAEPQDLQAVTGGMTKAVESVLDELETAGC